MKLLSKRSLLCSEPIRMTELSQEAMAERDSIIKQICEAFVDISRDGLISWSESVEIDNYGSPDACEQARTLDKETHWTQLIDDQSWQPFPGLGGFSFIDDFSFQYYLPPTMIRFLKGDDSEWYPGHLLGVIDRFTNDSSTIWTSFQLQCIARFISFMSRYTRDSTDMTWSEALRTHWISRLEN